MPVVAYFDEESREIQTIKVRCGIVDLSKDCNRSKRIVINPGSVGMPKDRLPQPSYVILDTRKRLVEFRRISTYDPQKTIDGYKQIRRDIREYLTDGLNEFQATEYIWNIEKEIRRASHPRFDRIPQDWRDFYESNDCIGLKERETNAK